jgi:RNA-directed DNA polymerase
MYEKIYSLENLYLASKKAQKGKKSKNIVGQFWLNEDKELFKIHNELKSKTYQFGKYTKFTINDNTVQRQISSAPFRDRVVHHAIMNIIEPIFEKSFIYDTYANRKGKGVYAGLKRARFYANRYKYYLKLDIKKYFPSIDHEILKSFISKKI